MVVCPECEKEVKDAKFCSNCGALLPKVEEPVEAEEVVEPAADEGEMIEVKIGSTETDDEPVEVNNGKKSKFCPNCGEEIAADVAFCPKCGFQFNQGGSQTKFCQSCGKKINVNAEICPYCGVRVAGIVPGEEKNALLAAILSFFFPGLGHIYNGLTKKGVSFIIAYIVSAVLTLILIGVVLMFIVWVWALIDAIKTTEAINNGEYVEDKLF